MIVGDIEVFEKYNQLQSFAAVARDLKINRKTVSKIVKKLQVKDNSDSSFLFSGMSNNGVFNFQFDAHGEFLFGVSSDQHLCSKYERLDLLNDLYDRFEKAGCKYVFNAGNWVDGEATFNRYDIKVAGVNGQLEYLAKHYPQRKGITTYAVAGDDHENSKRPLDTNLCDDTLKDRIGARLFQFVLLASHKFQEAKGHLVLDHCHSCSYG